MNRRLSPILLLLSILGILFLISATHPNQVMAETFSCALVTEIPQDECGALVAIYSSTGGANWKNSEGWLVRDTPCSWYGITCNTVDDLVHVTRIEFGSNNLQGAVPPEIGNLKWLTYAYLAGNKLNSLPAEIGDLDSLQNAYLNSNALTNLPPEFGDLNSLRYLDLRFNALTEVPEEIGNLSSLLYLDLSFNALTSLPLEIGSLSNLSILTVSWNQLTMLPAEVSHLSSLRELDVSGNKVTDLPSEFDQLASLTKLRVSWNSMERIPDDIFSLSALKVLNWGHNGLTNLPSKISKLTWLEELVLGENQLTSLPSEIGDLARLRYLSLGKNQLTSLPSQIGNLAELRALWLDGNKLSSLPPEIGELSRLTSLGASGNQLKQIPSEIGALAELSSLYLSGNPLVSLPSEVCNLSQLSSLGLSNVGWSGNIPDQVLCLQTLTSLDLSSNEYVGEIPTTLVNSLPNLRQLDLSWNFFQGPIPVELASLSSLVTLKLNGNQLSGALPAELGTLSQLQELNLVSNQFTGTIPAAWGSLVTLKDLNLSENPLSGDLALELTNLQNLWRFTFSQTGLCQPQNSAIEAWLRGIRELSRSGYVCNAILGGVGLYDKNVEVQVFKDGSLVTRTVTSNTGMYTVSNLISGTYVIVPDDAGITFEPVSQTVTIPPGGKDVWFGAYANGQDMISGHIQEENYSLAGVTVRIQTGNIEFATFTTDSWGRYSFYDLDREEYTIIPEKEGYLFSPISYTVSIPYAPQTFDFTATNISLSGHAISGVISQDGFGLGGVSVAIETEGIEFSTAMSDESGAFSFTDLDRGIYLLTPKLAGYVFEPAAQYIQVPFAGGSTYYFYAIPVYGIDGIVTENGTGVEWIGVNIQGTNGTLWSLYTDTAGAFSYPSLKAGEYTLVPQANDYVFTPISRTVTLPPDGHALNFEATNMNPGFAIRGSISENGFGLADVTINIYVDGNWYGGTYTGLDGSYEFVIYNGMASREYEIVAVKDGYTFSPASRKVTVAPSVNGVDFSARAVPTSSTIAGSVSENGFAIPGVTVHISTGGIQFDSRTTGVDGYYSFTNLEAGAYIISVEKSEYTFSPDSVVINVPTDRYDVDFYGTADANITYSISGRVTENGVGLGNVLVSFGPGGQSVWSTLTDSDGWYRFEFVQAGLYTIRAERTGYDLSEARTIVVPPDAVSQDFVAVDRGRRPVIILPGFAGSYLKSIQSGQPECVDAEVTEIWPNLGKLGWQGSSHLRRLQLQDNGVQPKSACDVMKADGVWDEVFLLKDMYEKLEANLTEHGYHVIPCGYDWRRFLDGNGVAGTEERDSLLEWIEDYCIKPALKEYSAQQVDIVAHSTGGLLARAYVLSSPEREDVVNTIVSLGTPYLGTLRPFVLLRYGITMISSLDMLITPEDLTQAATNWPALYQLMPSRSWLSRGMAGGYFRQGVSGKPDYKSFSSFAEMEAFLESQYNKDLVGTADRFHSGRIDNWNGDGIKTRYFVFVGTRIETPFIIHETTVKGFGESTSSLDYWTTPVFGGDGTVALSSANLNYGELAGDATICTYVGVDHGELTSNSTVLEDLRSALGGSAFGLGRCESANQMVSASRAQAEEIMERRQLIIGGDARVDIWDGEGLHTGPTSNSLLVEQNIPRVTFWADKHKTVVGLEPGRLYTVTIQPQGTFLLDVRLSTQLLREATEGTISETVIFQDVPVNATDKLTFLIQPQSDLSRSTLESDQNQDGTSELLVQPTTILDAVDSADRVPPVSHFEVQGKQDEMGNFVGTVTVSLEATDEGAGVGRIEYSVDGGKTGVIYTGPFEMNVEDVPILYAQATDLAGNTEYPWMELRFVRPPEMSTFLPLVAP